MSRVKTSIKRQKTFKKVPNRSHRAEEHNNWTGKLENILERFHSTLDKVEVWISKLGKKAIELIQSNKKRKKVFLKMKIIFLKNNLEDLYINVNWNNIHIMESQKGKNKKEERDRKLFWRNKCLKLP